MIRRNNCKGAPFAGQEKKEIDTHEQPEGKQEIIQHAHINTWICPDGKNRRHIDYIAINHKYRDTVKRDWGVQNWRGG